MKIRLLLNLQRVQGKSVDIGGYYAVDTAKVDAVMRPSQTLQRNTSATI